ncbi:ARM repeat-containing protein [Peniophora sp. CONT]|nr:ARM repeat-containing protein [Peniophora sp. CONT]
MSGLHVPKHKRGEIDRDQPFRRLHVVGLIKDLNGNHVIQKCLNKLAPEDNQFIYNTVATYSCVEVATHRHGCCILQRCVDHASEHERDPYGNYVRRTMHPRPQRQSFQRRRHPKSQGNVCAPSVQKFSSNVIEKCIRVAEHCTRKMLIEELLNRTRLEKLLRDSYGNYCVQTALDYAEPDQCALLVEDIRPVLPLIRNTPYGKRIQNKLQREQMDHCGSVSRGYALAQQNVVDTAVLQTHDLRRAPDPYAVPMHAYTPQHTGPQGHLARGVDAYVLQGHSSCNLAGGAQYGGYNGSVSWCTLRLLAFWPLERSGRPSLTRGCCTATTEDVQIVSVCRCIEKNTHIPSSFRLFHRLVSATPSTSPQVILHIT